jgi:glutamine amidotransferase
MQLLFEASEEGDGNGIGLIPGTVRRLEARVVPQMGWNEVATEPDPIFGGVQGLVAYYANSYVCEPTEPGVSIASTEYEGRPFVAGVRKGNTWGLQFHPEKSSGPGLRIIRNFLEGIE